MNDTELYQQILGLESTWKVEKVELNIERQRVDVWVSYPKGTQFSCTECGQIHSVYDHAPERTWRHLNTCQFETHLHARIPRVKCAKHGVKQINVSWAHKQSGFTLLMERFIIDLLCQCQHVLGVCRLLNLGWYRVFSVMKRAVNRGILKREILNHEHIGVDEKAFKKGHNYITVVCDKTTGGVVHVAEKRTEASLNEFYQTRDKQKKESIKSISMDMWPAYINSTKKHIPDSEQKIVFDRFHVMKDVNEAVNKTRRQEHKALVKREDTRLSKTRFIWMYSEDNLPEKHQSTLEALRNSDLLTAQAWAMKENLRHLWHVEDKESAAHDLDVWINWVKESGITAMIKVAEKIERHKDNILTHCNLFVTNGLAEGINSKIMAVKRRVGGFRNIENFKTAIYFYCGKLDLYP